MEKAPNAFRIISEVASELDVPQHVLRFWESRFSQIRPMKRGGGRRYYRPDDIDLLRGIRHLLYSEGYTIRGVQRLLREQGVGFVQAAWQTGVSTPDVDAADDVNDADDVNEVEEVGEVEDRADDGEAHATRDRLLLNLLPGFRKPKEFLSDNGEAGESEDSAESEESDENEESATRESYEDDTEDGDEDLPLVPAHTPRIAAAVAAVAGALAPEQIAHLEAALEELSECRRLIDEALTQQADY